jgi:two-component system LytT family response regulator
MKYKVAIIDDELHAIETLVYDLNENFGDEIDIIFTETNPVEGLKKIRISTPELLFLDIQMPGLSGIDILQLIDDLKIMVVITSAHEDFAIQSVGTKAIAYILKPISIEQLTGVMEKVRLNNENKSENSNRAKKISIPVHDGLEIISINEIVYCKSDSNYTELILTKSRKLIASKTLKYFTSILPENKFLRIHKSYLINIDFIKKYLKKDGGEIVMSNNDSLPISRKTKNEILKLIQKYT